MVATAAKLEQVAALFLARLAVGGHADGAGLAHRRRIFALGDAGFGFGVQRLGFRRTTAHNGKRLYYDSLFIKPCTNLELIADTRLLARLAALAAMVHLAALDGRLGQGTGFEEPHGPQPLVQPDLFFLFLLLSHLNSSL